MGSTLYETQTLLYCSRSAFVTFIFSIENYKRPQEEVDGLLNLAREKFRRLIKEADKIMAAGIRINVIGNVSLLPKDLQDLILQSMECTKANRKAVLNVAFSYTSRDEMTNVVRTLSQAAAKSYLEADDIDIDLIERCLYTSTHTTTACNDDHPNDNDKPMVSGQHCLDKLSSSSDSSSNGGQNSSLQIHAIKIPQPDLLIRTSGEVRLSDFLLWQSTYSVTYFTNVLWPGFGLCHFMAAIFYYQRKKYYAHKIFDIPSTC